MKLFLWFGVTLAACGMVIMLFSERLSGFSVNRVSDLPPGSLNQVHWYLLVGIVLTLGGGLVTQFGPTISRYVRQHRRARQRTALVARAG
jgi:drug/metabolite transporter (DMT)-like permease